MPHSQEALARLIEREGLRDPRVAKAFQRIDRADFVPEAARRRAYADRPVAIPHEQTTSQPSLIARMIDVAAPQPNDRVLEIGTGYGFQTALLAELAAEVVSIDRFPALIEDARRNLAKAGIENAELVVGDGWKGWPERAPFQRIIVTAAPPEIPSVLVDQLAVGGVMVVPVGRGFQQMTIVTRTEKGVAQRRTIPVRFVPMVESR